MIEKEKDIDGMWATSMDFIDYWKCSPYRNWNSYHYLKKENIMPIYLTGGMKELHGCRYRGDVMPVVAYCAITGLFLYITAENPYKMFLVG